VPVVTVPLLDVAAATPRSRLLTLDLRQHPFEFLAGQAVLLGVHGQGPRRPYSIACSPERAGETGRLELLVALEADGGLGQNLSSIRPGSPVDLEGPLGTFVVPNGSLEHRLLFVAGGTGIAPLRAMLDHVLRHSPSPPIAVLYSARRPDEFAFIDELREHARTGRIDVHQTVTRDGSAGWSGGRGRIGRSHFEKILHDPLATLCFICGPRAMVSESVAALRALGVPEAAIRTEGWAV